jgi:hypothetical protein
MDRLGWLLCKNPASKDTHADALALPKIFGLAQCHFNHNVSYAKLDLSAMSSGCAANIHYHAGKRTICSVDDLDVARPKVKAAAAAVRSSKPDVKCLALVR